MDAEATTFADASFDIAVGMFVASVVPNPKRLAGGDAPTGAARRQHPAHQPFRRRQRSAMVAGTSDGAGVSCALGWHPDFAMDAIFSAEDLLRIEAESVPPFGVFTLVRLRV